MDTQQDTATGIKLLDDFRALVRREIEAELQRDGYCKRFEGTISYTVELPPVVDWSDMPDPLQRQPDMAAKHELNLYCYVIGPARTYKWTAPTAEECFARATADFMGWVAEAAKEREESGDG